MTTPHIDIVFDGPPSHETGRFVEVENAMRQSICFGTWVERDDGYWVLRITPEDVRAFARRLNEPVQQCADCLLVRPRSVERCRCGSTRFVLEDGEICASR